MFNRVLFSVLAGLFTGFFSYAWQAWWYIFDMIIATLVAYIIFELIRAKVFHKDKSFFGKQIKDMLLIFLILFVVTAVSTIALTGVGGFTGFIVSPIQLYSGLKTAAYSTLWPNVLTTVAELNSANIATIISQASFGINIFFTLSLLGIIFKMVNRKPSGKEYLLIGFSAIVYLYLISSSAANLPTFVYLALLIIPVLVGLYLLIRKETHVDVKAVIAYYLVCWYDIY